MVNSKVLIVSMPRCYTKAIQHGISLTLGPPQLKLYNRKGIADYSLGEAIHFNECTVWGYDEELKVRLDITPDLRHYMLRPSEVGLRYEKVPKQEPVPLERVLDIIRWIGAQDAPGVMKFFPHKLTLAPNFSYTDEQQDQVWEELKKAFNIIIPVMRLDADARIISSVSAQAQGWWILHKDREAAMATRKRMMPDEKDFLLWVKKEHFFRRFCLRHSLSPIWCEDLVGPGKFKQMMKERFNFDVKVDDLPPMIEYSDKEFAK